MRRERFSLHRPAVAGALAALLLALSLALGAFAGAAYAAAPAVESAARVAAPHAPSLSIAKTLVAPTGRTVFYTGETVTFDIKVTNNGTTTVAYLRQSDEFGTECLAFEPKASPPESDYDNSFGVANWYDLTTSNGVDLAPGSTFTTRVNFVVTGPHTGTGASSTNTARIAGARDANGQAVPDVSATLNFTCALSPAIKVDKTIKSPAGRTVLLTGETVTFDVAVKNTGPTRLDLIPLQDQFDTTCLEFVPKADPPESGYDNNFGVVNWYDLTAVNGQDLPPGSAFTTSLSFKVTGPSTSTPISGTNTALVSGALDQYGSVLPPAQDTVLYTCAQPAAIGDYVWQDANGNGLQDEPAGSGLNGVTLRLYKDDGDGVFEPGTGDVLQATTVTSGDGGYLFDILHAGSYWVDIDQSTVPGGLSLTVGTHPRPVTVDYGQSYLSADFGFAGADLAVTKTDSADPVQAGGALVYTIQVHNNGPSAATNVVVTDPLPAGLTFVSATPAQASGPNPLVWNLGTIAANTTKTITVNATVAANVSGTINNTVQATTDTPETNTGNNSDSEPTLVINPAIKAVKSANPTVIHAGNSVAYTYEVTNPGDVPLKSVSVSDDKCSPATYVSGDTNSNTRLDVGEVWIFRCSTTLTVDTINTATATGTPVDQAGNPFPGIGPVVSPPATASVDVITPGIHVVKSGPVVAFPGETVTFTFQVTNVGDTPLSNVTVTDNVCGPATYQSGDVGANGKLDLTETWVFTCQYTIKATDPNQLVNIAQASGRDVLGKVVTDDDTWQTELRRCSFGDYVWYLDSYGNPQPMNGVPVTVTGTDVFGNPVSLVVPTVNGNYLVNNLVPGTYTASVPATFSGYLLATPSPLTFTLTPAQPQRLDIDFGYVYPTGVQLVGFAATPGPASITLAWEIGLVDGHTAAPHFHVWRQAEGGAWKRLTAEPIGPASNDGIRASYNYEDLLVTAGQTYLYELRSTEGDLFGPWQVRVRQLRQVYLPLVTR
jgi:uncharacterized repeat protein (TIGR01451 family)